MNAFTPTRRAFLKSSALTFGLMLPTGRALAAQGVPGPMQPNAFVRIAADDLVTVIIKHIEFGQGPATGLATLVADELDADWGQMRVEMSPANDALYKNLAFGTMGTGGSTAMANSWVQMRTAGASARAMFVEAAARRWGVPASSVTVAKGVVSSGTNSARFGELVADAAKLEPPTKPVLKTPDRWTLIGTDVPKIDSLTKSDGSAMFTMDIARPDMVHSAIAHPPSFGAKVGKVDDAAARAVPGVLDVKTVQQGVAVYASDFHAAMKGRAALAVEWDESGAEKRSSETLYKTYAQAVQKHGANVEAEGDVSKAMAGAAKTVEATYYFPFLAHAPMEPLDAVMHAREDAADVWMGSQFQVGEMTAIAGTLGLAPDKIVLHQQYAGGSFGRRAQPDMGFAVEAASVAKAYGKPVPVKHVWTRENDIRGGRYRPLVVHRVQAGLDAQGKILGWDHQIASQSFFVGTAMEAMSVVNGIDNTIVEGVAEGGYKFPNHRVGLHMMENGVPTLWWRSVGHTHTAYAMETMVDEALATGGQDLVEGRLAMLKDDRQKAVLTRVAELSGWGGAVAEGRARGIAVHKSFGSYVAQVAEVSQGADGLPRVHKIWCAVDCGVPINPNVIRAQMEGGIGYGLGHALYAELVLGEGGRVDQGNFDTYRSLRINEMPEVEVAIIASTVDPTGVGEPGVPPSAPAIANAWRKLTGKAVRRLPFAHGDNA